jgi:hypothetical protein
MSEVRDQDQGGDLMSASRTRAKTPEGGHSGPSQSGLEKPAAVGIGVQTELGCLPAGWRVDRFDSEFDVQPSCFQPWVCDV